MENREFISAANLPTTEAEEVDVLCVEGGEMKRKPAKGLGGAGITDVFVGNWVEGYNGSTYNGNVCYKDQELTEEMPYAEFKEIAQKGFIRFPWTETYDDGSTWDCRHIGCSYNVNDAYKFAYFWDWDCYLFFADTELPAAAAATMALDDEMEAPASIAHTPYPPRS